jgi:hypothetical protein
MASALPAVRSTLGSPRRRAKEADVDTLLAWYNLIFYIPIAFGALLALGAAFGFAGGESEADGDAVGGDTGDSSDAGADSDGDGGLSLLALGKLPLTLRLMLLAFGFGGVGLVVGPIVQAIAPGAAGLGRALTIGIAVMGGLGISSAAARLVARYAPMLETETVRRVDLVGLTGRLVLAASDRSGVAQVRDGRGNLYQVTCRLPTGEVPLPSGTEVLLVDYDEPSNTFIASRNPLVLSAGDSSSSAL